MLSWSAIFLFFASCFLAGCSPPDEGTISLDPNRLPYRFSEKEFYSNRYSSIHFADLDGDGIEARILVSFGETARQSSVVSSRYNGTTISQVNLPAARSIRYQFAYDINNDGFKDLFLVSQEHDSLYLSIVNVYATGGVSEVFRRFPLGFSADTLAKFPSDQFLQLHGVLQGTDPKGPIIFASLSPGVRNFASEVFGFYALTGGIAWHYPVGPRPEFSTIQPAEQHDKSEIFFGTTSSGTANRTNGTDDMHTYLLGLRGNGESLWKPRLLGGAFAS